MSLYQRRNLDELWNTALSSSRDIRQDLRQFPEKCRGHGPSPKTIHLYLQVTILYLRECGLTADEAPLRRIKKPVQKTATLPREMELTRETIRTVLSCTDLRMRAEILIAASSEMRIGEILRITFHDINLTARPAEIYIPAHITKNETLGLSSLAKKQHTPQFRHLYNRSQHPPFPHPLVSFLLVLPVLNLLTALVLVYILKGKINVAAGFVHMKDLTYNLLSFTNIVPDVFDPSTGNLRNRD